MKNAILTELASIWKIEARTPDKQDGSPEAERFNDVERGRREAKRECADLIMTLVDIFGDTPDQNSPKTCQQK